MLSGFGLRTFWAIVVAVVAAFAVLAITGGVQGAIIAVVGGVAAALVAAGTGEDDTDAPAPASSVSQASVLDELLDAIVTPVLLIDDGRIALANRAARTLLGSHIVGEDARVAIRHPAAATRLAASVPAPDHPVELVGLGTRDQRWEMRVAALSDGRRIVHLIDQTGNYAAERMRIDFVANASHELRTPLASILGFVETLSDEAGEDPAIRARFLKIMDDEAKRMLRLVEELISLSRIEAEKFRVPDTAVDLVQLVAEVRAELADAGNGRGRDLVAHVDPDVAAIAGDRVQLSQMLHNLMGNAMKYGRAGTPVTVALGIDVSGMIRLSVRDEGEGIAAVHIPRLTERFYRVDAGRSRALGGTGLGLAIVKHIVERHRGRLDIASQVGIGTTVSVVLPPAPVALSSKGNANVTQARSEGR